MTTMTLADFKALAQPAYPLSDDDWGSERQIDAENAFFERMERELPQLFTQEFEYWMLKATTEERLDEALARIAKEVK
jgi:hypothetical protein